MNEIILEKSDLWGKSVKLIHVLETSYYQPRKYQVDVTNDWDESWWSNSFDTLEEAIKYFEEQ